MLWHNNFIDDVEYFFGRLPHLFDGDSALGNVDSFATVLKASKSLHLHLLSGSQVYPGLTSHTDDWL